MAQQADDHVDVCCQIPDETVAADLTDTTMFGTTPLLSFSGLVENVPIDAVVKVMYKYKESNASHLVVIGPNGFQMCRCLQPFEVRATVQAHSSSTRNRAETGR